MKAARRFGLPPKNRIKRRREILEIQNKGRKLYSTHFLIVFHSNELARSRLAVTITRKVDSSAVKRNRLRRRIREVFRLHRSRLRGHLDLLVIARRSSCSITFDEIREELLGVLTRGKLLERE